jgi:hypothetical protein
MAAMVVGVPPAPLQRNCTAGSAAESAGSIQNACQSQNARWLMVLRGAAHAQTLEVALHL